MKNINDTEDVDEGASRQSAKLSEDKFYNRHDKIVKLGFSNIAVAQGFLQDNLPSSLKDNLNLASLKPLKTSFIDKTFKETFCDVAFDCNFKDKSQGNMKLIILIEHQSTPDRLMPFRVLHYLNSLLYNELNSRTENKQAKLPPAFAMVLYHGKPKKYPYVHNLYQLH